MSEGERVGVRTYVPRYQRENWDEEADRLDMSRSEFVRTMVQAGRRELGLADPDGIEDGTGGGETGLEDHVLALLSAEGPLDWDELLAGLTDDVEDRLDEALAELQDRNRVRYSGRDGGYTLTEDGNE